MVVEVDSPSQRHDLEGPLKDAAAHHRENGCDEQQGHQDRAGVALLDCQDADHEQLEHEEGRHDVPKHLWPQLHEQEQAHQVLLELCRLLSLSLATRIFFKLQKHGDCFNISPEPHRMKQKVRRHMSERPTTNTYAYSAHIILGYEIEKKLSPGRRSGTRRCTRTGGCTFLSL